MAVAAAEGKKDGSESETEAAGYPFDALPQIDYRRHPAYAVDASLGKRVRALAAFGKGLAIVLLRWLSDYEHLPKPPEGAARLGWFVSRIPAYAWLIPRQRLRRLVARRPDCRSERGRAVLDALERDGVAIFHLTAAEQDEMRRLLAPAFDALGTRLAAIPAAELKFDDNRLWLDSRSESGIYRWFTDMLGRAGAIEASSTYLGRPVSVAHLIPQTNLPENDFWRGRFADAGIADPASNYCHVDTAYNVTKMIIYVDEVTRENGPFSFVAGSHRANRGFLDGLVRRANDYAGLSATAPRQRALFASLPRFLRKKCAFGADVADDHPHAGAIRAHERHFTSDQAHAILFDPAGIHRGGMVSQGSRRVVTVLFSEAAQATVSRRAARPR